MKAKLISIILFGVFILVGCASETISAPTDRGTLIQSSSPASPTSTPMPTIRWIVATPFNKSYSNNDELISILDQLHPDLCIKNQKNLLLLTPAPVEPGNQAPSLVFTEITTLPEPNLNYFTARADNADMSRTVYYLGHEPGKSGNLYVKNNDNGKINEIYSGATYDSWLQWINRDTFIAAQQGHVWINLVAINIESQQLEYFGMISGCPSTPTP